ncbi:MAG TPA: adenosylcobinamide-GDP ribazoletransferase [Dongiaceae bacterium]|nr:adenosylcobinamide-GDP ribazoletransferase [Dongiaceae bacterium]
MESPPGSQSSAPSSKGASGPSSGAGQGSAPNSWGVAALARDIRFVLSFFTRLPVKAPVEGGDLAQANLAGAARAFPIAGLAVGLVGALIYFLAVKLDLSGLLAALLAVAATVIVAGALHEDGLADFADMLGVRGDRARKLEVMRDSRIGSYGVLALGFAVAIKVGALVGLGEPRLVGGALVAAHVMGRAVLPVIMRSLPLARADGLAHGAGKPTSAGMYQALGLGLLLSAFAVGPGAALVSLVVGVVAAYLVSEIARRQIGGYTGDVLGAAQEVAQLAILINIVSLS